jgi:hypothetical protein
MKPHAMSLQATSMQCFIATYSLLIDCFISAALVSSNALLLCDIDAPKRLAWLTTVPSCVIVARLMLSTYSCRVMLLRDVAARCCFLKSWREATWKFPGACMRVCVMRDRFNLVASISAMEHPSKASHCTFRSRASTTFAHQFPHGGSSDPPCLGGKNDPLARSVFMSKV